MQMRQSQPNQVTNLTGTHIASPSGRLSPDIQNGNQNNFREEKHKTNNWIFDRDTTAYRNVLKIHRIHRMEIELESKNINDTYMKITNFAHILEFPFTELICTKLAFGMEIYSSHEIFEVCRTILIAFEGYVQNSWSNQRSNSFNISIHTEHVWHISNLKPKSEYATIYHWTVSKQKKKKESKNKNRTSYLCVYFDHWICLICKYESYNVWWILRKIDEINLVVPHYCWGSHTQ